MPLFERVRVEIFIPDLPDPAYARLLDELSDELSYAFGGCSIVSAAGKYRSFEGAILPDQITILFTDTPFDWELDQRIVQENAAHLQTAVRRALPNEEAILICVFPVSHAGYIAAV
ncbi:MAG: hypothetical protein AABN33_26680 [Acidobacteriota bacterium]